MWGFFSLLKVLLLSTTVRTRLCAEKRQQLGVSAFLSAPATPAFEEFEATSRQDGTPAAHSATVSRSCAPSPAPTLLTFTHFLSHLFTSPATGGIFNPLLRDGNFLGQYRGTYHLPRKITREFATNYNRCLSGQYKYRDYPRDLCCCEYERNKGNCDWRLTLGRKGDPVWEKPVDCQSKCMGLKVLLDINHEHKHCRHAKCLPIVSISLRCTASSLHTALHCNFLRTFSAL